MRLLIWKKVTEVDQKDITQRVLRIYIYTLVYM